MQSWTGICGDLLFCKPRLYRALQNRRTVQVAKMEGAAALLGVEGQGEPHIAHARGCRGSGCGVHSGETNEQIMRKSLNHGTNIKD